MIIALAILTIVLLLGYTIGASFTYSVCMHRMKNWDWPKEDFQPLAVAGSIFWPITLSVIAGSDIAHKTFLIHSRDATNSSPSKEKKDSLSDQNDWTKKES